MISGTAPVSLGDLQAGVEHRLEGVRGEIRRLIEADFPLIAQVNSHLTQMQGKMFRPTLLLLADEATGGRDPRTITLAATVELIHLATLVQACGERSNRLKLIASQNAQLSNWLHQRSICAAVS